MDKATALRLIADNIKNHGFHIYVVGQDSTPRFAYTIGLRETIGAELVLGGAIYYFAKDVMQILHAIREQAEASVKRESGDRREIVLNQIYAVKGLGSFTLRPAHGSWSRELLLGAFDYYRPNDVEAYQLVPDAQHRTIDVPDMTKEWSAAAEPAWRWMREPWPYSFPEASTATTNLAALRGEKVTEVARWEAEDWEMFAGDGTAVPKGEMRVVPITCLVAADPTLAPALELSIGEGIWRDADGGDWNVWESSSTGAAGGLRRRFEAVWSKLRGAMRDVLSKTRSS